MKQNHVYLSIIVLLAVFTGYLLLEKYTSYDLLSQEPTAYDVDQEEYSWKIEPYAQDLEVPWDMRFDSQNNLFFTERPGKVKLRQSDGQVIEIASLSQVASVGESGLTGIELHPNFEENKLIYLYYTARKSGEMINRIARFVFSSNQLQNEQVILDNLPGGTIHNGGRLRFGPDGKLYILTGDAGRPGLAQDIGSLGGKILRINEDGSTPDDNPFENSAIYSLGHRNPQGVAWHPLTEEIVATEHGETAHDEINIIKPGQNYGWPEIKKCFDKQDKFTDPIICSGQETYAPSGIEFLGVEKWRMRYSFIFAGLRGNVLERVELIDGKPQNRETIIKGDYGRLRAVTTDKEGNIYVSTSNRDGRGNPKSEDDQILKITPVLKN